MAKITHVKPHGKRRPNNRKLVLGALPSGWRKAFGEKLCAEVVTTLKKEGKLHKYNVLQARESCGCLEWRDTGGTPKIDEVIRKYQRLSTRTCVMCGNPATKMLRDGLRPLCSECAAKFSSRELMDKNC